MCVYELIIIIIHIDLVEISVLVLDIGQVI